MFSRGGSPIEMAPSQWMRTVNAWLLRAATICSTDGRNVSLLTPGFPLGYVGQWMRDSFYGISSGIDLLPNLTATVAAVEWVFEHARPVDGLRLWTCRMDGNDFPAPELNPGIASLSGGI